MQLKFICMFVNFFGYFVYIKNATKYHTILTQLAFVIENRNDECVIPYEYMS